MALHQKDRQTPCKGCGNPIVWARNIQTNAMIPLDPKPPVYTVIVHDNELICSGVDAAVSHFVTCPQREQFTKKKSG